MNTGETAREKRTEMTREHVTSFPVTSVAVCTAHSKSSRPYCRMIRVTWVGRVMTLLTCIASHGDWKIPYFIPER